MEFPGEQLARFWHKVHKAHTCLLMTKSHNCVSLSQYAQPKQDDPYQPPSLVPDVAQVPAEQEVPVAPADGSKVRIQIFVAPLSLFSDRKTYLMSKKIKVD